MSNKMKRSFIKLFLCFCMLATVLITTYSVEMTNTRNAMITMQRLGTSNTTFNMNRNYITSSTTYGGTVTLALNDAVDISKELEDHDVIIDSDGNYLVKNIVTNNSIVIKTGNVNLTINNLTINNVSENSAISINKGTTLNLTVLGENNLTGGDGFAAINVEPDYEEDWSLDTSKSAKLNILGDGTLTVKGGSGRSNTYAGGAGIGGNGQNLDGDGVDFGIITVTSDFTGTINATGGESNPQNSFGGGGAGIGSGGFDISEYIWEVVGQISLQGGTINANTESANKYVGAGIGGGSGSGWDTALSYITISITSGTITAQGGAFSAGIGGGNNCDGGYINISGGIVDAKAGVPDEYGFGAAGIGGGDNASVKSIKITGGNVIATASGGAAGIGGGSDTYLSNIHYGDRNGVRSEDRVGQISISGINTKVIAYGGTDEDKSEGLIYGGAGIGSGQMASSSDYSVAFDISIGYGATVYAFGGYHAQAIGYGYNPSMKNTDDGIMYNGYGIKLYLDDSITLWAVNDDYFRPALVQKTVYDKEGTVVSYGDISYVSDDIYLVTYTDKDINKTGNITEGVAIGQLQAAKNGLPEGVKIDWKFDSEQKLMTLNIEELGNTVSYLNTPFSELHGNWATLNPAPISIVYEWVGEGPSDVNPPETEFVVKGTEYYAKKQDPSEENYVFDGWYTDSDCTKKFEDGTVLEVSIVLYGKWVSKSTDSETGTLTIEKKVTGEFGEKDREFEFKVSFDDNNSYTYTKSDTTTGPLRSGDVFTLKSGETITINGLPAGIKYSVTELDANKDNYKTTVTNDSGIIMADENIVVVFTNHRSELLIDSPPTGDNIQLWLSVIIISGFGMISSILILKRK